MRIELIRKSAYGRELLYVNNVNVRATLEKLTNKKTLSRSDIELLRKLGHEIEIISG